ncbi:GTP-binding protein [Oceanobacillus zhaokaii]|uniref:GTP-binding protein n=1 Tax=Oceanobacillus zhaokaii TaxID=2052660 RepID=A0A345PJI3_9BACI|nr:GTPase [Oceanobacillus zhaokaii]AXI10163.1 GTP-binding protein [Oceanobacillus zhaokaii]
MTEFNEKEFEQTYEQETDKINEQLDEEILFAMIGDVNTGKSSTVNQLIGDEVAPVGANPGETIGIDRYVYRDKIIFVDTPGLDDINSKNSEETLDFFEDADVILFFLNAAGTVFSEGEKKSLEFIEKKNKNILFVLNKIDAADDIPGIVKYVKEHSNNRYKVVPISSRTGENIEKLRNEILDILKKKHKEIQFARLIKEKSSTANKWILAAAGSATAIGAAPIPGSDFVPLTGIQVGLMVRLAALYEKPLSKERAKELTIATITGNIGKTVFRQVIKFIPGAGSVAGGSIAGGMTLALGYAIKYAYENNIELDASSLKHLYELFRKKEKENL